MIIIILFQCRRGEWPGKFALKKQREVWELGKSANSSDLYLIFLQNNSQSRQRHLDDWGSVFP